MSDKQPTMTATEAALPCGCIPDVSNCSVAEELFDASHKAWKAGNQDEYIRLKGLYDAHVYHSSTTHGTKTMTATEAAQLVEQDKARRVQAAAEAVQAALAEYECDLLAVVVPIIAPDFKVEMRARIDIVAR